MGVHTGSGMRAQLEGAEGRAKARLENTATQQEQNAESVADGWSDDLNEVFSAIDMMNGINGHKVHVRISEEERADLTAALRALRGYNRLHTGFTERNWEVLQQAYAEVSMSRATDIGQQLDASTLQSLVTR